MYLLSLTIHSYSYANFLTVSISVISVQSKIEVPRFVRNWYGIQNINSEIKGLKIRTNASPKWDRTRCPEEYTSSVG